MCAIHDKQDRYSIQETVAWFVTRRKQFTGKDVYERWAMRQTSYSLNHPDMGDVSSYVREMFNQRYVVFRGYGCYPVEDGGPLLFFPVPSYVKGKSKKIAAVMKAVANQEEQIALGG